MNSFFFWMTCTIAGVGHVALGTWFYNRLHGSRLPSKLVKRIEKYVVLGVFASLVVFVLWLVEREPAGLSPDSPAWDFWVGRGWLIASCTMFIYVTLAWAIRRSTCFHRGQLLKNDTEVIDMVGALGERPIVHRPTYWQSRIWGNQILEIHLQRKTIAVRNLPAELEGLRIAQLSDLHMSRNMRRAFFETAVEYTNAWDPDLVALTGDLVEESACIEWIPSTLGRLTSRFGVYALLGNHEQRLDDVPALRGALVESGLVYVGGRSIIQKIRNNNVLVAGNECPWFPPAPHIPSRAESPYAFSILMAHSPDPLPWARRHQFNLMLAGHTHGGGQIRFPIVGAVVCPSRYGVWYASGVFHAPPVLLHVNRGLSGTYPWRFHCPPEITLLELRSVSSTVNDLDPCAPITSDCSMSAVLDGPEMKIPKGVSGNEIRE